MLILLLLVAGAVAGEYVAQRNKPPEGPPLSSRSAAPDGALALNIWLRELGYDVRRTDEESEPLSSHELLFVLQPLRNFELPERRALVEWVRDGGVLVYVPSPSFLLPQPLAPGGERLEDELGLSLSFARAGGESVGVSSFFSSPPGQAYAAEPEFGLQLKDDAWLPLIESENRQLTIAATRQLGLGRVYAASSGAFFSNAGLDELDNAAFVLNILARHASEGRIVFEEDHHSLIEAPGLLRVVRSTPWGWALLYSSALTFAFILWGGRRFGPALVPEHEPARSAGEYVTAFAGLLQRARAAAWAQAQYALLVRRRLARRLGVGADLPGQVLAGLYAERHAIDASRLADHMAALEGPSLGERGLLVRVRGLELLLRERRG